MEVPTARCLPWRDGGSARRWRVSRNDDGAAFGRGRGKKMEVPLDAGASRGMTTVPRLDEAGGKRWRFRSTLRVSRNDDGAAFGRGRGKRRAAEKKCLATAHPHPPPFFFPFYCPTTVCLSVIPPPPSGGERNLLLASARQNGTPFSPERATASERTPRLASAIGCLMSICAASQSTRP